MRNLQLNRRSLLRGTGMTLALPWLEVMGPQLGWADDTKKSDAAPNRMALLYVPNGKVSVLSGHVDTGANVVGFFPLSGEPHAENSQSGTCPRMA